MKYFKIQMRGKKNAEIYLYQDIGDFFGYGVTAKDFTDELNKVGKVDQIDVRINSEGGSVFEGMAIHNALVRNPAKIVTHTDYLAASIASVIFMAGDERHIANNGTVMIHEPWGGMVGTSTDLRAAADRLDMIEGQIVQSYMNRVNIDQETVVDMIKAETWMDAAQALDQGFATHISEEIQAAAHAAKSFDLTKFRHPPDFLAKIASEPKPAGVACDALRTIRAKQAARKLAASGQSN